MNIHLTEMTTAISGIFTVAASKELIIFSPKFIYYCFTHYQGINFKHFYHALPHALCVLTAHPTHNKACYSRH